METISQAHSRTSKRVQHTHKHIIQAAAQLFAERGYKGTTTLAISEAAGVSELTLFRHFSTKKNLFVQVITTYSPLSEMTKLVRESLSGNIREDLSWIGRFFLQAIHDGRSAVLMTLNEAERFPDVRQANAAVLQQQHTLLTNYLREKMDTGDIKRRDAEMLAQGFLGMLFSYGIQQSMFADTPPSENDLSAVVALFVEIFLDGVTNPIRESE